MEYITVDKEICGAALTVARQSETLCVTIQSASVSLRNGCGRAIRARCDNRIS